MWFGNIWGFDPECPYPGDAVSSSAGHMQSLLDGGVMAQTWPSPL